MYETMRFLGYEINGGLVVLESYLLPVYMFSRILLLLQLEHVFVEVKLESLIRIVYAQLLKAVHFEVFKAKDIQQGNRVSGSTWDTHNVVDSLYEP